MSLIAAPPTADLLAARSLRYCARAEALTRDPALTMAAAARALDHLAALQDDLARERARQSAALKAALARVEGPFKRHEAALDRARAGLSEALLRAKPDSANPYGPTPHCGQPDPVANCEKGATAAPRPQPQPVSACRALLDLEALRPYLREEALRQAIERYAKDTGAWDVQGVAYAVLPASGNPDFAVY